MLFRPIMDPSYPSRRTLLKGSAALTGALVIGVATGLGTRRVKAAADVHGIRPAGASPGRLHPHLDATTR